KGSAGIGRASLIQTRRCSSLTSIPRRQLFRSGDAATRCRVWRRQRTPPQRNAAGVRTDQAQRAFQGQCWQDTLLAGRANHDFLRVKGVKGVNMRTRTVALLILICWFVLAPGLLRAADNEWYQGQQGQWQRHGKQWRWESTHGDDWYQGQQGHWYNEP